MSIYNINENNLSLIKKVDFKKERELQRLTENNLEELFNLKFIATEFQVDNLRIDTLAYDSETNSFVIIEYKNTKNYSVIDQGYSYLLSRRPQSGQQSYDRNHPWWHRSMRYKAPRHTR